MIIIGGMGSLLGSYFGAAFIIILPLVLNQLPGWLGIRLSTALLSNLESMLFGSLIVFFPDRGAAWTGAPVCDRQGKIAAMAVSTLRRDVSVPNLQFGQVDFDASRDKTRIH